MQRRGELMVSFTVCEFHLIFRCVVSQHLPAKDSHTCLRVVPTMCVYSREPQGSAAGSAAKEKRVTYRDHSGHMSDWACRDLSDKRYF